jgi:hypothetical protein
LGSRRHAWLLFDGKIAKVFQINVSKRTRWSKVPLPCQNPHCILNNIPLDSRNHRQALIILSMVLQTQIVSAIGR